MELVTTTPSIQIHLLRLLTNDGNCYDLLVALFL